MEPTTIFPERVWRLIFTYLDGPGLLNLWRVNSYFFGELTSTLVRRKDRFYGTDIIHSPEQFDSILTTYYLLNGGDNILTSGIYNLRNNLICDRSENHGMFIIRGRVIFRQNNFEITLRQGCFFIFENGSSPWPSARDPIRKANRASVRNSKLTFLIPAETALADITNNGVRQNIDPRPDWSPKIFKARLAGRSANDANGSSVEHCILNFRKID